MSYPVSLRASFAGALRAEMARQHKTSSNLADALSISQSSASRRMNGQVPVDLDEVSEIADWLQVPIAALIRSEKVPA